MEIRFQFTNVQVADNFEAEAEKRLEEVLAPFADKLTRVEVRFRDDNAHKGGPDTHCVMEARPRGLDPIAIDALQLGPREAFRDALDKLSSALGTRFGKLDARRKK